MPGVITVTNMIFLHSMRRILLGMKSINSTIHLYLFEGSSQVSSEGEIQGENAAPVNSIPQPVTAETACESDAQGTSKILIGQIDTVGRNIF